MFTLKSRTRRAEIRKARPEAPRFDWEKWREQGVPASLAVAFTFFVCATAILMNRQDIERLGLRVDQRVTVRSATGAMPGIVVRAYDIRAGK